MIELIESMLASMYDAFIRGICWSISISISLAAIMTVLKYLPKAMKAAGIW